jgi:hypothetical protein
MRDVHGDWKPLGPVPVWLRSSLLRTVLTVEVVSPPWFGLTYSK